MFKIEEGRDYPSYEYNNVITYIKATFGIIYVNTESYDDIQNEFIMPITKELDKLQKKNPDHLSEYSSVETGNPDFTILKIKPKYSKKKEKKVNPENSENPENPENPENVEDDKQNNMRLIEVCNINSLLKVIDDGFTERFCWLILSITDLVKNINYLNNGVIPIVTQLCSIFYDSKDILKTDHDVKLNTNITLKDFKLSSKLIVFSDVKLKNNPVTKPNECPKCHKIYTKYLVIHIKWCRDVPLDLSCKKCGKEFKTSASLQYHEKNVSRPCKTKYIKNKDDKAKEMFNKFYKSIKKIPEFYPQWNIGDFDIYEQNKDILICPKRRCAFEIISYFGKINAFDFHNPYITSINNRIYDKKYKNLDISNSYKGQSYAHLSNDICSNCHTPLYGEIYVVAIDITSEGGYPICGICAHSSDNKNLIQFENILFKVKYPRKVDEVIEKMKCSSTRKRIISESFIDTKLKIGDNYCLLVLGKDKKYIGWNGSLSDLLLIDDSYKKSKYFRMKFVAPAEH